VRSVAIIGATVPGWDAQLDRGQAEGPDDPLVQVVGEGEARPPLDDLGDQPGRRGEMELEAAAGRVVEPPTTEGGQPLLAVQHLRVSERREGEARGVREHLLDRHRLLPVGRELRDDRGDLLADVQQSLADQLPHGARDDRPSDGLQDVPGVRVRVAPGLESHQSAAPGDGDLGGGQRPVVDFETDTAQEQTQPVRVDADGLRGHDRVVKRHLSLLRIGRAVRPCRWRCAAGPPRTTSGRAP
jgi:hypothetical protein